MDGEEKRLIEEIRGDVIEIKTVLLGVPDTEDTGLVGEMKDLRKKYHGLSRRLWIVIGILVGSGLLGAGAWGIINGG